jgi:glutathione S-transferase
MMLRIWGRPTSGCTQRSLWCLEEAGVPFQFTLASAIMGPNGHISKGGKPYGVVDTPEYLRMNPNGTVPTIDDDGYILWESNAILAYIALHKKPDLYGNDHHMFGRAVAWGSWSNGHLDPPMTDMVLHHTRLADHLRDKQKAAQSMIDMAKQTKTLERELESKPYLAGDAFTIADISAAPAVYRWHLFDDNRAPSPNVDAWIARLSERPAFRKHIMPREYHFD